VPLVVDLAGMRDAV